MAFQRKQTNNNTYKLGDEVLGVMLEWLLEHHAVNVRNVSSKSWTVGRVALATPGGAKTCVQWSCNAPFRPIRWSRVSKECS